MEGAGLASSSPSLAAKRELSEKELEAAPALLMLFSRADEDAPPPPPRPVENGLSSQQQINHLGSDLRFAGSATTAVKLSLEAIEGEEASSKMRGTYRPAFAAAAFPSSQHHSHQQAVPPQPTMANEYQAPRARVSIYSLLNDDADSNGDARGTDPSSSFLYASSTTPVSSSSRSTPSSPVSSSSSSYSSSPLPSLASLLSAGRAGSPPMARTASDVEVRASGRNRSKSAGGRKLLSSSSPASAQKPPGGRKRKASSKASATAAAVAAAAAATSTAPSTVKNDRRTKKQRQLELLQSVNSGRSVSSDSLGAEDIAATLAASPLAFSSPFLPSMFAATRRARTSSASEDAISASAPMEATDANGTDLAASSTSGSMLPPAPLASYLSAMSSPLPAGAASPLPLPSSLAQLQQLLPSPLPAGVDQQRVMQLKSQLVTPQAPSSPGGSTNTTPAGSGVASPGANVHSMANYLNLNLNVNSHHINRFGDKKRERRDSFSFTYPNRNGDQQQHPQQQQQQQNHHSAHGPAAAPPPAPLPQHQQEFLQQLLQQIHKKQTVGTTPPLSDAAAPQADSGSPMPTEAPTSPSLFRFYQRPPPHKILPAVSSSTSAPSTPSLAGMTLASPSVEADALAYETVVPTEAVVLAAEAEASLPQAMEEQLPEAESSATEGGETEVAVEVEVEVENEPMDIAGQLESNENNESNENDLHTNASEDSGSDVSGNSQQESASEMRMDEELGRDQSRAEVEWNGQQEGRTGSIESHQPGDQQQELGSVSILVEGENVDYPSGLSGMAEDLFAGRRKKASPQQMAILEQIWSTAGFRGAFRASTTLDFTSSFPSATSPRGWTSPPSASAKSSPQLSSSSSSSSSPAPVADTLFSTASLRPTPVLLASSSPTLSFAVSSPNLPSFLAASAYAHAKKSEALTEQNNDDEHDASGGLTIQDDDDDEEPANEREVESLVIASVPTTTLPHFSRSAILLPSSASYSSPPFSSSTSSPPPSSSSSSAYDRANMERSQPGGGGEGSMANAEVGSGEIEGQRRGPPASAADDATNEHDDRCVQGAMSFGAHSSSPSSSCVNGSVGA